MTKELEVVKMPLKGKNRISAFPLGSIAMALIITVFLLLSASGPDSSFASEQLDLSLNQAYNMALESNHDIRIAAESVEQGKLLQKQAITVLFPELTANAGYNSIEYQDGTKNDGSSWGLSLNQTVYNGGRVWVAKRGAEYTLNAALRGLDFARQSVLIDLISRANALLTAEDLLKVSEKRVQRVQEQLRQAQARVDLGDMPRTNVLDAKVALSSVQLERVEAQKTVALAGKRLSTLIGADVDLRVEVPEILVSLEGLSLQSLVDQAVSDRPDLAQSRELIRIAREEAELTRRNGYPDVDITGSYTKYSDDDLFAPETQIGINLSWPFFQGGLVKLQTRESLSKVRQAEETYESQLDAVSLEVEEALLTLQTRRTQKQLVTDNLTTAMENHRLAKARFDLGAASSLEVLDAEENLAEAENLEVNYKYDTSTAQARLLYSIGALDLKAFGSK